MLVNYHFVTRESLDPNVNTHSMAILSLFTVGLLVAPEANSVVCLRLGGASFLTLHLYPQSFLFLTLPGSPSTL